MALTFVEQFERHRVVDAYRFIDDLQNLRPVDIATRLPSGPVRTACQRIKELSEPLDNSVSQLGAIHSMTRLHRCPDADFPVDRSHYVYARSDNSPPAEIGSYCLFQARAGYRTAFRQKRKNYDR